MPRYRKGAQPTAPPTEVALLGPMIYCARCHEWWPADGEFFFNEYGRPTAPCRACRAEMKQTARLRVKASA